MTIRPLTTADCLAASGLLAHLNPDLPSATLLERFRCILEEHPHYFALGAFDQDRLVGLAGVWIATKIWCGRYLELDNLVVHPLYRSSGIGSRLIAALEDIARERECNIMVLDSYTSNHPSHRLYHRLGFEIWGFHFVKPVGPLER